MFCPLNCRRFGNKQAFIYIVLVCFCKACRRPEAPPPHCLPPLELFLPQPTLSPPWSREKPASLLLSTAFPSSWSGFSFSFPKDTLSMHKGPMSLAAEGLGRLTAVVLVGREELAGGAKFWAEGAGELRREAAELPTGCSAGARCPLPRAAFSHA